MIIPIVSAVCREVFLQVPRETIDAAWALGATKWEMIRTAVLPFGRAGIISAAMLGLGRALGETIAVALVLNSGFRINWHLTEPGGDTFASTIALKFGEAGGSPVAIAALIAAGLFLFVITLVVNSIARDRHRPPEGVHGMSRPRDCIDRAGTPASAPSSDLVGARLPQWAPYGVGGRRRRCSALGAEVRCSAGPAGTPRSSPPRCCSSIVLTAWSFSVEGRRRAKDRFASTLIYASFVAAIVPLVLILGYIGIKGFSRLQRRLLPHVDERGDQPARRAAGSTTR